MDREIELLTEIRDLLVVIAEPALARRDETRRAALRRLVGTSEKKARAIMLMDGTRSQSVISKESSFDTGNLSRFVKALTADQLIAADDKFPTIAIKIPPHFFDKEAPDGP